MSVQFHIQPGGECLRINRKVKLPNRLIRLIWHENANAKRDEKRNKETIEVQLQFGVTRQLSKLRSECDR